jgi:hypothetical protein
VPLATHSFGIGDLAGLLTIVLTFAAIYWTVRSLVSVSKSLQTISETLSRIENGLRNRNPL